MLALIIIPYFLRKSHLFTWFNFFLAGSALFIGISGIGAAQGYHFKPYPPDVYYKFFAGLFVFYAVFLASYAFLKLPRRMAGRNMLRWPEMSTPQLVFLAIVGTVILCLAMIPIPIPFFRQLSFFVFLHVGPFAAIFAIAAIHRNPSNPLVWVIIVVVFSISLLLSVSFGGGGRRIAMGTLMTVPIYFYWSWLRYKPILVQATILFASIAVAFMMLEAYDQVRHRRSIGTRGVEKGIESLKLATERFGPTDDIFQTAQPGVECALLAIRMYSGPDRHFDGQLFHAVRVVLVNPIPRELWENKPESLGHFMPIQGREKLGLQGYDNVNWGLTLVGQGYHDGGLPVIIVYALFAAFGLRYFDEMLIRQSDNPFQLGLLAAASGHVTGWPRGGIDVMTLELIACVMSMWLLLILGRLFFGVGRVYPKTDHIESYATMDPIAAFSRQH
jgi:hypothetical protein